MLALPSRQVKRQHDEENSFNSHSSKRPRYPLSPASGRCLNQAAWGAPAAAPASPSSQPLHAWLRQRFPAMDDKTVSDVLSEFGNNIEGAIKKLEQLTLSRVAAEAQSGPSGNQPAGPGQAGSEATSSPAAVAAAAAASAPSAAQASEQQQQAASQPSAEEWVDFVVTSMTSGFSSREAAQAKSREVLGKVEAFFVTRVAAEATATAAKMTDLQKENYVLKRAVQIQNGKLQAAEEARLRQEAVHLAQVRALELTNYSLGLHLREATSGQAMPGQRRPDVF